MINRNEKYEFMNQNKFILKYLILSMINLI
jgi:hypothetical protein